MTTTSWSDIKARRAESTDRQHGYDRAGRAIRLAIESPTSTTTDVQFRHGHLLFDPMISAE
jgi:hypothetical protein